MRNIILADNQDITSVGIQYILEKQFDIVEIQKATKKTELFSLLVEFPSSMVVLDYTLFDFESANELIILQVRFDKVDWLLFSDELSRDFIHSLLYNTHSFSILMKDTTKEEVGSAIKEVLNGNRFICSHIANLLLDNSIHKQNYTVKQILTSTEQEILKEMALGRTTKEIATNRHVSVHTIMTHRKNIFRKIEVNNVHEATKYAFRAGMVDVAEYYI